ncbi:hypothetical protein MCOR25_009148 [Pyricularia grisea]|nr:hypothetical protein MCOR25_009148 [Pyricularia grisea]
MPVPIFNATPAIAWSKDSDLTNEIEIMGLLLDRSTNINTGVPGDSTHPGFSKAVDNNNDSVALFCA